MRTELNIQNDHSQDKANFNIDIIFYNSPCLRKRYCHAESNLVSHQCWSGEWRWLASARPDQAPAEDSLYQAQCDHSRGIDQWHYLNRLYRDLVLDIRVHTHIVNKRRQIYSRHWKMVSSVEWKVSCRLTKCQGMCILAIIPGKTWRIGCKRMILQFSITSTSPSASWSLQSVTRQMSWL